MSVREATDDAEIAQLVEHHLAKVGVAGPSPVFRSMMSAIPHASRVRDFNLKLLSLMFDNGPIAQLVRATGS